MELKKSTRSIADELKKLHELLESGIISKEDFEQMKEGMLGASPVPRDVPKFVAQEQAVQRPSQGETSTASPIVRYGGSAILLAIAFAAVVLIAQWLGMPLFEPYQPYQP